MHDVEMVMK